MVEEFFDPLCFILELLFVFSNPKLSFFGNNVVFHKLFLQELLLILREKLFYSVER